MFKHFTHLLGTWRRKQNGSLLVACLYKLIYMASVFYFLFGV